MGKQVIMDSINRQQEEKNHEDLIATSAIEKMKALSEKAKTCFFCTKLNEQGAFATRPMSVQKMDDDGTFLFLSAADSYKNAEISSNKSVQLLFQADNYSGFMTVYGEAEISKDKGMIKELWEPLLKTWFTEGIDDPRITVISVKPRDGYYWDTKHGKMVAFAKQLVGAMTGKTLDDSIEGNLRLT